MSHDEEQFVNNIKQQLDQQAEGLDGQTLSRLRQARATALAAETKRGWHWQPLAAVASVSVLAVAVWLAMPVNNSGDHTLAALDDLELLASTDELEFYEEIEFYEWVGSQDEQG